MYLVLGLVDVFQPSVLLPSDAIDLPWRCGPVSVQNGGRLRPVTWLSAVGKTRRWVLACRPFGWSGGAAVNRRAAASRQRSCSQTRCCCSRVASRSIFPSHFDRERVINVARNGVSWWWAGKHSISKITFWAKWYICDKIGENRSDSLLQIP